LTRIRLFPTHGGVEKANRALSDRNVKIAAAKDKLERVQRIGMAVEKSHLVPGHDKLISRVCLEMHEAACGIPSVNISEVWGYDRLTRPSGTSWNERRDSVAKADVAIVINEQRIISSSKESHAEWKGQLHKPIVISPR
jgi:hypothetical protein